MFIPLNAGRREYTGFPVATALIVVVNVLVYAWEVYLFFGLGSEAWIAAMRKWGFTPSSVITQEGWRGLTAFTSMYLHGDPGHIFFNMVFLWVFGPQIEDLTGSWQFFLFYTLGGLMGNALTLLFAPQEALPGIGASGAIAGVLGAYLFLYPGQRVRTFVLFIIPLFPRLPAWALLGFWVLEQAIVAQIILLAGQNFTGIGVWTHLGGFVGGVPLVYLFLRKEVVFNRETAFRLRKA